MAQSESSRRSGDKCKGQVVDDASARPGKENPLALSTHLGGMHAKPGNSPTQAFVVPQPELVYPSDYESESINTTILSSEADETVLPADESFASPGFPYLPQSTPRNLRETGPEIDSNVDVSLYTVSMDDSWPESSAVATEPETTILSSGQESSYFESQSEISLTGNDQETSLFADDEGTTLNPTEISLPESPAIPTETIHPSRLPCERFGNSTSVSPLGWRGSPGYRVAEVKKMTDMLAAQLGPSSPIMGGSRQASSSPKSYNGASSGCESIGPSTPSQLTTSSVESATKIKNEVVSMPEVKSVTKPVVKKEVSIAAHPKQEVEKRENTSVDIEPMEIETRRNIRREVYSTLMVLCNIISAGFLAITPNTLHSAYNEHKTQDLSTPKLIISGSQILATITLLALAMWLEKKSNEQLPTVKKTLAPKANESRTEEPEVSQRHVVERKTEPVKYFTGDGRETFYLPTPPEEMTPSEEHGEEEESLDEMLAWAEKMRRRKQVEQINEAFMDGM